MTVISIFGKGSMGTAIADLLVAGGVTVEHIGRGGDRTLNGDVVILAVPWEAFDEVLEHYGHELGSRIVVDVTNPVDFDTFAELKVPVGSSAAAELQAAIPRARVVKAFNTTFAATLAARQTGPNRATVLVAGDDADAKLTVLDAVRAGGVDGIDVGGLVRAHELEAVGFLQLTLANDEKISWTGGFGVVR